MPRPPPPVIALEQRLDPSCPAAAVNLHARVFRGLLLTTANTRQKKNYSKESQHSQPHSDIPAATHLR